MVRHVKKPFEEKRIGGVILNLDLMHREVNYRFIIGVDTEAQLNEVEKTPSLFEINIQTKDPNNSRGWSTRFSFDSDKRLHELGDRSQIRKTLINLFERQGLPPKLSGDNTKEKVSTLFLSIHAAKYTVEKMLKSDQWGTWENENPDEVIKEAQEEQKSWADITGHHEEFEEADVESAKTILESGNFLKSMVDTISGLVMGQRDKIALASVISLSACLNEPLHSLSIGSPGTGKSSVGKHIFKVFPKQRKFEFTTESTLAGLINVTKYAEGEDVFKGKLLYVGDLGNEEQQKNPKVQEILGMLRVTMEGTKYTKILTDTRGEEGLSRELAINGVGCVMVECVSKSMEGQFEDRCIKWSPNGGLNITKSIDNFHNDEIAKALAVSKFDRERPVIAAGVDEIFAKVEWLSINGDRFEIFNPFNDLLFGLFNMSEVTGNRGKKDLRTLPKMVTLANIFQRQIYRKENDRINAIVVAPEDLKYTLKELGKAIGYMMRPTPENVLSYLDKIDSEFFQGRNWPYTYAQYEEHFMNAPHHQYEEREFIAWVAKARPITAKQMAKIMNVQPDTAREYLNDLAEKEILYLKAQNGKAHQYFPVTDFEEAKETMIVKYPTEEEIDEKSDEIQQIYDEFVGKMDKTGFKEL